MIFVEKTIAECSHMPPKDTTPEIHKSFFPQKFPTVRHFEHVIDTLESCDSWFTVTYRCTVLSTALCLETVHQTAHCEHDMMLVRGHNLLGTELHKSF